jgi:hypothetical protein
MIGSDNIILSSLNSASSGNILTWNAQDRLVDSGVLSSNLATITTVAAVSAGLDERITALPDGLTYNMLSKMDPATGEVNLTSASILTSTAFGKMHSASSITPFNITLPNAVGNVNKVIGIRVDETASSAMFTVNCSGSQTIDGSGYRMMWAGECAILKSNGSNWNKIAGKSIPMTAKLYKIADQTNNPSATYTLFAVDTLATASNSACYSLTGNRLIIPRPGNYEIKSCLMFTWLGVSRFTDPGMFIYKNGSGIQTTAQNSGTATYINYRAMLHTYFNLTTNDYIQLYGNPQTSNATFNGGPIESYISFTEIVNW